MMRFVWILMGLAVLAGPRAAAAQEARAISLAEAEQLALHQSPELAIAGKGVDSARRRVQATRALRLPRLSVESNVLVWNEEVVLPLAFPAPVGAPDAEGAFERFRIVEQEIVARGRVTSTTSVTLAQPLTNLFSLNQLVAVETAGVAAIEEEHRGSRIDVAFRAIDGYLTVLLATAATEIAAQRAQQVEAQLTRARVLVDGGVLQPVDAMRLEAAMAAARREHIMAGSRARLAAGALALTLGLPPDTTVQVRDDLPEAPGAPPASVTEAMQAAAGNRPDVRALALRAEQAARGAGAARAGLLPSIAAIASFQHNQGGGTFQSENAWFAGLSLQWNVWDWGNTWHTYQEAALRAEQAALAAGYLSDAVRVEVSAAAVEAQSAYEALAVARTGLAAAEEAFRIQNDRFGEGVATTTDLLDAQTEVTQARLGYASARYAYFRALAALARATGQLPSVLLSAI